MKTFDVFSYFSDIISLWIIIPNSQGMIDMYNKSNITNSLNYINHNLDNNISIEELAYVSGYSLSQFYKLFTSSTGFTVKQYIRNKRLSEAAKKLVTSNSRIIDIAMDANFQSHEVFTRAFYSLYGITPSEYRKSRNEIILFEKYNNLGKYIKNNFGYLGNDIGINVQIKEPKEIYLVGMDINTTVTENIKKNIVHNFRHSKLLPNVHKIQDLVNPIERINFEITNPMTNELYHFSCFQVSSCKAPKGMKLKIIPSLKYAVFTPSRPLSELEYSSLVTYAYGEWLPISGYQLADDFTFDLMQYTKSGNNDVCSDMKVYIPIK